MSSPLGMFWLDGAEGAGTFTPVLPGWIVLLPLLGFLANGWLALSHARRSADAVRRGEELDLDAGGR
ncbi:MAG: hypothetical protein RLN75_06560, partial [Longimicrobiales bacterium]